MASHAPRSQCPEGFTVIKILTSSGVSRRKFVGTAAASAALSMTGCSPQHRYRFRLTFEFSVAGRSIIASGVWEEGSRVVNAFPNGSMINTYLRGDAVPIDLGAQRVVFAMLVSFNSRVGTGDLYSMPLSDWRPGAAFRPFMTTAIDPNNPDSYGELTQLGSQEIELSLDALPAFAGFRDRNNPESGFLIAARDFASPVGADVVLKRAAIEVSNDPVTRGIEKFLPWMAARKRDLIGAGVTGWSSGQLIPNTPYFSR